MATQQEDRYQTVKEFQEAIRVYQSHSESLVLTAHANQNLQKAREADDYQLFARALYGFQESLTLWDANHRARTLLDRNAARLREVRARQGRPRPGRVAARREQSRSRPTLLAKIDAARAERDARQRRLRRAKQAVAALVAAVVDDHHDCVVPRESAAQEGRVVGRAGSRQQRDKAEVASENEEAQRHGGRRAEGTAAVERAKEAEEQAARSPARRATSQEATLKKKIAVEQEQLAEASQGGRRIRGVRRPDRPGRRQDQRQRLRLRARAA